MAIWPWANRHELINVDLSAYPNVKRWYVKIAARPAVQRGFKVPDAAAEIPMPA
jgi:GST-like protein